MCVCVCVLVAPPIVDCRQTNIYTIFICLLTDRTAHRSENRETFIWPRTITIAEVRIKGD